MKIFKYVFVAAALGLTVTSCADMDLEPKGLLYDFGQWYPKIFGIGLSGSAG